MNQTKNEKVVHTRISQDLYDKISTKAKKHRITTSNLLRNMVEDYLEIHGEVWDAIDKKLRGYLASGEDAIVGFQTITLNRKTNCELCGKELGKGESAFIGFFEKSNQKVIVCPQCQEKEG